MKKTVCRKWLFLCVLFAVLSGVVLSVGIESSVSAGTLRLSAKEKRIQVGRSFTLRVTGGRDLNVTWTSFNTDVATVDDYGVVKGIAAGKARVVANVSGFEFECAVTVFEKEVRSISITKPSGKYFPGETIKLKAKTSPSDAKKAVVNWISAAPEVATVSNQGEVKCIKPGDVEIEASVRTSEKIVSKKIRLKITEPFLKLSKKSLSLKTGQIINALSVKYCSGASVKCEWSSENTEIVDVDENGKITAKAVGRTYITAKYKEVEQKCKVTVRTSISRLKAVTPRITLVKGESKVVSVTAIQSISTATKPAITFSSSEESVAVVDASGKVTAVSAGSAKILAMAEGKKTTITVKVVEK